MGLKILLAGVVAAFYGLFMAAVITKYREVRRASLWVAAPAKIVSSKSEARKVEKRTGSEGSVITDTEIRNFAAVRYIFTAGGRQVTGSRISISEDLGNFQVAEKLARYPVGAKVTVYYDSNKPENCVLERDMNLRTIKIAMLVGSLAGACGMAFIFAVSGGYAWLKTAGMGSGLPPIVFPLVIIGLLVAAFANALRKRGAATAHWPKVTGTIVSSSVDTVKRRRGPDFEFGWRTLNLFRARTRYAYKLAGVTYESDRISFGAQYYANYRLLAKKDAARFTPGQPVEVFYNPDAPEQAVLTQGAPGQIFVWLAAAALLGGAAHVAGVI